MMGDSYVMLSDFVRSGEDKGNFIESFADLLDKIFADKSYDNKITPIYVTTGGYGSFSVEPLFIVKFNDIPFIFSTLYRLHGPDENSIVEDNDGENFIYNVYNYNNSNVYNLGVYDSETDVSSVLEEARNGNIRQDKSINADALTSVIKLNGLSPVTHLDLPNGGMLDVYSLNGAMMDSVTMDKNFNNGQQTIVDFDHANSVRYIVAIGGNPIIKNIGVFSDSNGFLYTAWTNNEPNIAKSAENIIEWFPFDLIEPDITDMTSAMGEHIILHRHDSQLRAAEENMEINN